MAMNTLVNSDTGKHKVAQKLIVSAWIIEIIAASVGLFFAISRLIPTDGVDFDKFSILSFQGALPFFAVAVVEVTKIPLAYVAYQTTELRWKIVFGISLLLAMFLTFETFFAGFDNYQAQLNRQLKPILDKKAEYEMGIAVNDTKIAEATQFLNNREASDISYKEKLIFLNAQQNEEIQKLEILRQKIIDRYSAAAKPLTDELDRNREKLASIETNYKENKNQINSKFDKQIDVLKQRIDKLLSNDIEQLRESIKDLQDEKRERLNTFDIETRNLLDKTGFFQKNSFKLDRENKRQNLENNYDGQLAIQLAQLENYDGEVNQLPNNIEIYEKKRSDELRNLDENFQKLEKELDQEFGRLNNDIAVAGKNISQADQLQLDVIEDDIEAVIAKYNDQKVNEKNLYDDQNIEFGNQASRSNEAIKTRDELREKQQAVCSDLNFRVAGNQIYSFAMQFFAKDSACDLSVKQLSIVKVIWFGSLALIISGLGTMLALAAFVVRDDKPKIIIQEVEKIIEIEKEIEITKEVIVEKKVPIEVIKEVPVEKVVFRDVPVEIVRKEIVHVPIYTNDRSLINSGPIQGNKDE